MLPRISDPNPSLARPRRLRPLRRRTLFAGGLLVAVLSISAGIALLRPAGGPAAAVDTAYVPTDVNRVAVPWVSEGRLYPFSVVARGVHTRDDLTAAMERDAVVADHYGSIAADSFRLERVASPRLVYVSYRKGDDVYWTRNRVPLYTGETVLTDGRTSIRARCGNRISETPMAPTLDDEPTAADFDRAVDPGSPPGERNVALPTAVGRNVAARTAGPSDVVQGADPLATVFMLQGVDAQASLSAGTLANLFFPGVSALREQTSANRVESPSDALQEATLEDLLPSPTATEESGGELQPVGIAAVFPSLVTTLTAGDEGAVPEQRLLEPLSERDPRFSPVSAAVASVEQPVPVPEPASLVLVGLGLGAVAIRLRRSRRR